MFISRETIENITPFSADFVNDGLYDCERTFKKIDLFGLIKREYIYSRRLNLSNLHFEENQPRNMGYLNR